MALEHDLRRSRWRCSGFVVLERIAVEIAGAALPGAERADAVVHAEDAGRVAE